MTSYITLANILHNTPLLQVLHNNCLTIFKQLSQI